MERKEALEVVRKNMPTDRSLPVYEALQTLIPELAESEDERIRKDLITYLKSVQGETLDLTISVPKWIAYLEKQKYDRMKPVYDARESFESALVKAWNDYHNGYEMVDKLEDDYVECAHAKGFREGYLFGLEKQKENPKSADSIPSDCVSDAKCEDRWHKVGDSLPDNPREVLCKDEAGNYFIGRYYVGEGWEISNYDDEDKPHHLNPPVSKWIDFPSEKQKEQKPAEWSDEDENKIESIKGLITTGRFADTNTIRTIWKLLDSLRPCWKPSEEQMEVDLEKVVMIDNVIMNMTAEGYNNGYKTRPFYEEVLRRFNARKEE